MPSTKQPIHVLQIIGDPTGGVRRHVHSLLNGLNADEFRLSYVYSARVADAAFLQEIAGLQSRLHATLPLNSYKQPHPSDIGNILALRRFMRKQGVHIVHGHGAKSGMYARIAGHWAGAKTVYTPHGGVAHDMFSPSMALVYRAVERLLVSRTDFYLFESAYTERAMRGKLGDFGDNWSINPNGVEPVEVSLQSVQALRDGLRHSGGDGVVRLGVFGTLREEKGQSYAIEALAELLREGRKVALHLFGEGSCKIAFEAKAATLGVQDRVFFHGDVSPVEPWMAAMDVVLVPSLFESFGYVAVEAMMVGAPIIASATGGLVDVLADRVAALVPPGDSMALAAAVRHHLDHPEELQESARRGRARALQYYSATAMVSNVAAVYRRLAPAHHSSEF